MQGDVVQSRFASRHLAHSILRVEILIALTAFAYSRLQVPTTCNRPCRFAQAAACDNTTLTTTRDGSSIKRIAVSQL
jgi:hypothetical protein